MAKDETLASISDDVSRETWFAVGAMLLAVFAGFSLLGGLASSMFLLILARILMGVGAAMMWPAWFGVIYSLVPESKAGLAGGLVIGVAGIGNAIGPVITGRSPKQVGGTSSCSIFQSRRPPAATWILVPGGQERQDAKLDLPGRRY